ncbi:gas vesicle protein [Nocardia sp. ET3-3]|uniref:Gas vesicle protein n=1 Tax=Nocardia terrae TaxID=2675851 RepID=A0A7K1USI2_9NOCA|nr:gas vesicle protein GvpO [Nocardia terrae]MVU77285.1 gas vesicle protein [Nocardia terrae]
MADQQRSRAGTSRSSRGAAASDGERLSAAAAAAAGIAHITQLTGQSVLGATAAAPGEHGWTVEVEVLEETHIPSSADVLALYCVELDPAGELLSYRRIRRGQRCTIGDDRR